MMYTYEKVMEYLKSYRKLSYDIEFYRNKMEGLKAISYSQEEKGTSLDNMMSVYIQKIEKAENKQREIENFIETNFTDLGRLIIYDKFVKFETFKSIGAKIGYTNSHCKKLMDKAIYRYLAS